MTPFLIDILWLLISVCLGWIVFERSKPKERQSYRSITIIGFISWFVFKTLHRAVITTKGTPVDALLVGGLFGAATLLICFAIKWFFSRHKES
jgi:TctA family transporter